MFNNAINSLHSQKHRSKIKKIFGVVALVYLTAGIVGVLIGKYDSKDIWGAYIAGAIITLLGWRWIQIIRRQP